MTETRDSEPLTATQALGEMKYEELARARVATLPEFRQAMKFIRLHGLVGWDEVRKAWERECAEGQSDG